MSYLNRLSQNVTADANNSSTSNLAGGAIFVGAGTSTLGVAAIQVSLKTDQNCTLYVEQANSLSLVAGKGTVAANNTTTLTGTGTQFTWEIHVGDTIVFDSGGSPQTRTVTAIASDTSLTVNSAFTGGALSGKAWQYYPWDITDSYNFYAAIDDFGITIQAVGAYVRIRLLNISSTTTAYLRLSTVLCPIVEAVPRSLDADGNLKTGIQTIHGEFGRNVLVSPMGAMKESQVTKLVGTGFGGTLDSNFWTASGTGTQTISGDSVILTTNGVSAGTSKITSIRVARYIIGQSNYSRTNLILPGITGANTRSWGAYTTTNGFFFSFDGTTLSVVCRKNSSDTTISSGSFNGIIGNVYTPNANMHTYEIFWTNKNTWFVVDGLVLHTFSSTTSSLSDTLSLNVSLECNNGVGNSNTNTLVAYSGSINRLGPLSTETTYKYIAAVVTAQVYKYNPGRIIRVIFNSDATQTVTVYDALTATNTVLTLANVAPGGSGHNMPRAIECGFPFHTALCVSTSTTAPVTLVYE